MRYNAKVTEPKWQSAWNTSESFKATPDERKNIMSWRCFPTPQVAYIWVM